MFDAMVVVPTGGDVVGASGAAVGALDAPVGGGSIGRAVDGGGLAEHAAIESDTVTTNEGRSERDTTTA